MDIEKKNDEWYLVHANDNITGDQIRLKCKFLCVTCGILKHGQFSLEERNVKNVESFDGTITYAARQSGIDSAVGVSSMEGKKVVIVGSGSFAAEAMEAASRSGSKNITIIGRSRYRWILPFSRQYTVSAIAKMPFLPWSWRMNWALVCCN